MGRWRLFGTPFSVQPRQGLCIKLRAVYYRLTFAFLGIAKAFVLSHLVASFAALPDPRCAGPTRHRLLDLLVIAVCAVVAGAETWVDIAHYGRMKHAWLTTFLDLPHGIPSHDTFRRVFSLVDPQVLEQRFRQWMATTAPSLPREVVAVDSKTLYAARLTGGGLGLYTWSVPSPQSRG